jgi:hypothetical protein
MPKIDGRKPKNVKTTWAIICSFVLAGTPFLLAQTPLSACAKQPVRACCHCGGKMPCCKAKSSPDSQSKPAVPAQTGNQSHLSLFAPNVLIWTLPANLSDSISSHSTLSSMTASAPIYARNCARLI